jgi:hypothetical protein
MAKEIVDKEDKVKSPPLEEGICSVFDFDKTYLFLDL